MNTGLSIGAKDQSTALLSLGLMSIIVMMVLPVPSFVLDIGLAVSFGLAILIFSITLFIERPLDFSSFPTILLGSLMLRLSLNVSSTKLIIGEGHTGPDAAGNVIYGFAMFIMGNNIFLGLVIFCVLLIVNFMVITKGAGRMAEVGARFALDGMPGKQLAIDSDVAAGAITHEEAKERRRIEQEETAFFGSLDGASKFVKGDAIAGLLITLLNIVVGLSMGIGIHGMSPGEAVSTYSILTVGDGLVSQIPGVIVSVAAGLLLSKGGASGTADSVVFGQVLAYPVAIGTVGAILSVFAFFPGLPFVPFALLAAISFAAAWRLHKANVSALQDEADAQKDTPIGEAPIGDLIDVDEVHLEFAPDLVPLALDSADGLQTRITRIRRFIASEYGFILPPVRLTDNIDLGRGEYVVKIQGVAVARDRVETGRLLVIRNGDEPIPFPGTDVEEPVYGAPARWVDKIAGDEAAAANATLIAPIEVISTHLLETIKQNFARLLTRRSLRRVLDEFVKTSDPGRAASNRQVLDEFIPDKAPIETVQTVLRLLLDEQAPIRNLPVIIEAIAEARGAGSPPPQIAEYVRQRIAAQITARLVDADGALALVQLSPEWEETFKAHERETENGAPDVALPPDEFNRLARSVGEQVRKASAAGAQPAIVAFAARRRFLAAVLRAKGIRNPVLSYEEIGDMARPRLVGTA